MGYLTSDFTFEQLQDQVGEWSRKNFPNNQPYHPLLGLVEEVGELSSATVGDTLDTEEWRGINGYIGVYEISDHGRARRVSSEKGTYIGKILKPRPTYDGYIAYSLSGGYQNSGIQYLAHVLVAEAWLGEKPEYMEVNHRDGNKSNNCVWNLEYVTASENQKHAIVLGLRSPKRGQQHPMAKLSKEMVDEIKQIYSTGEYTQTDIARLYGVSKWTVNLIVNNKIWQSEPDYTVERLLIHIQTIVAKLSHAHLKLEQGIRGNENEHYLAKIDAVGDILIYLADYCERNGIDMQRSVELTWDFVQHRDWQKNKKDGVTE